MSVASPSRRGPTTVSATLTARERRRPAASRGAPAASGSTRRPQRRAEVDGLLGRRGDVGHRAAALHVARRPPASAAAERRLHGGLRLRRRRSCRLLAWPATRRSRRRSGRSASSSSWRPTPTTSAVLEHDDLVGADDRRHALGDDDHRGIAGPRREGGAQAGVGAEVERREGVVEQVDLRPPDQRPGDRQALALATRQVRAALGDGRLQAVGQRPHEVGGLGDRRGRPTSRRRWRRAARSAGCWRSCR